MCSHRLAVKTHVIFFIPSFLHENYHHLQGFRNFYAVVCLKGEASEALALGPPSWGPPLRSYARKFSLFLRKNLGYYSPI